MKKKDNISKERAESSQQGEATDLNIESTVVGLPNRFEVDKDLVIAAQDVNETQKPGERSDTEDEEGDDAPQDVSWKASKETALQENTRKNEILLDTKRRQKQTRIERNERLHEQKEKKRAKEYSRLPQEVLQQVAEQQPKKEDQTSKGDHISFDSSNENEEDEEEIKAEECEDTPGIKVLVLPKETKKPKKIQEAASSFLQEHLYGGRLQRISSIKSIDLKRKNRTTIPALKFSKK